MQSQVVHVLTRHHRRKLPTPPPPQTVGDCSRFLLCIVVRLLIAADVSCVFRCAFLFLFLVDISCAWCSCRNRFRLRIFCLWFCVVVDLSCASWCADFRDTPLGSQKAPLKIKQMNNRGWKVGERIPYIFAYLILV